jgi:putative ABC transport system permease protein
MAIPTFGKSRSIWQVTNSVTGLTHSARNCVRWKLRHGRCAVIIDFVMLANSLWLAPKLLLRSPRFAALSIATVAAGSFLALLLFSFVEAVVLRPLPFHQPESIVVLETRGPRDGAGGVSGADIEDIRNSTNAFAELGLVGSVVLVVTSGGNAERVQAGELSAGVLPLLGIPMRMGSGLPSGNNSAVALLSSGYWTTHFAADPGVLGATIRYNGARQATVAGVLGPEFRLFPLLFKTEPLFYRGLPTTGDAGLRSNRMWTGLARLRSGVTAGQAEQQLRAYTARAQDRFRKSNRGISFHVRPLKEAVNGTWDRVLIFLNGAVLLVALAAAANTASLFLIRALSRSKEMAVRMALGANLRGLAGLLFGEALVVSVVGVAGGLALAYPVARLVEQGALSRLHIPRLEEAGIDRADVLYALLLAIVISALCALVSMLPMLRQPLRPVLGGEAGGRISGGRTARALVLFEVFALMLILSVGSLFLGSYSKLAHARVGYSAKDVLSARMTLPASLPEENDASEVGDVLARLPRLSPHAEVAVSYPLPSAPGPEISVSVEQEGQGATTASRAYAHLERVDSGYFRTLGVSLLDGHEFLTSSPFAEPDSAVVSQVFAQRWLNGRPIGAVLNLPQFGPGWKFTVVGVVGSTRQSVSSKESDSTVYLNRATTWMYVLLRPAGMSDAASVIQAVKSVDKSIAVDHIGTLRSEVEAPMLGLQVELGTLALFGAALLVVLWAGIYSTVSLTLCSEAMQIAIRAAIGATPARLLVEVVRPFAGLGVGGAVAGGAGAFLAVAALRSYIPELEAFPVWAAVASAVVVAAATVAAATASARGILSLDPAGVLRRP